jgi:transglutaminase-like putative cysteine protease
MESLAKYLNPTDLCDFDRAPEINNTARQLTQNMADKRQTFNCIYQFVKELRYGLEDWDVSASHTLRKGWGMCSGKTNLLVAMCRGLMIPARYRIFKIEAEGTLWKWISKQNSQLAAEMGSPLSEQDHVIAEVYLDTWEACDPSRDTAFEEGLVRLGIPLERKLVIDPDGNAYLTILASIDEWAQKRQQARRFKENREFIFSKVNEQFDRIRFLSGR